jgi:hypothetical protein
MMHPMETEALTYIEGLWGSRRREFGYVYWIYLLHGGVHPASTAEKRRCFGAVWIEANLKRIKRKYNFYARSPMEES